MIPIPDRLSLKLIIGIGCALLLALLIHDRNRWKAKTEYYATVLAGERAAHSATVANYRAAADRSRRADLENAARVKAEQAAISERTAYDYESRIAAARARSDELQRQARAQANSSRGGTAPVPRFPAAAQGASQAAGEDRLPHPEHRPQAEVVPLGANDALITTEQAIQLDELIKWVQRQHAVPVNGRSAERQHPTPVNRGHGAQQPQVDGSGR